MRELRFSGIAIRLAAVLGLALLLAAPARADDTGASADELVNRLMPKPQAETRGLDFRGLAVVGPKAQNQKPPATPVGAAPPSVDLTVNFEYNSASLTPDARAVLDKLGQALTDARLAGFRFRIVGHTDGAGGEDYNLALSQRRAAAVRDYLVYRFNVAEARLESLGRGKAELLDPAHPEAAANRRVQIVNLGK